MFDKWEIQKFALNYMLPSPKDFSYNSISKVKVDCLLQLHHSKVRSFRINKTKVISMRKRIWEFTYDLLFFLQAPEVNLSWNLQFTWIIMLRLPCRQKFKKLWQIQWAPGGGIPAALTLPAGKRGVSFLFTTLQSFKKFTYSELQSVWPLMMPLSFYNVQTTNQLHLYDLTQFSL